LRRAIHLAIVPFLSQSFEVIKHRFAFVEILEFNATLLGEERFQRQSRSISIQQVVISLHLPHIAIGVVHWSVIFIAALHCFQSVDGELLTRFRRICMIFDVDSHMWSNDILPVRHFMEHHCAQCVHLRTGSGPDLVTSHVVEGSGMESKRSCTHILSPDEHGNTRNRVNTHYPKYCFLV
jgi:hypothetical protein